MLKIQNLSFSYQSRAVLNNLSLTIKKGEMAALIGASGSGKTTLFRLIAGLISGKSGKILINELSPDLGRKHLSYMMQEDLLLPWKTALENILVVAEFNREKKRDEAVRLLEEVGLIGFENAYPHELSGGMRQRVALARALLLDRPLLILDEPFGSVDSLRKAELINLLLTIQKKRGLTLLFITHDMHEAAVLADRAFRLDEGRLIEVAL